jgi:N4-gp56 family major capsid protein
MATTNFTALTTEQKTVWSRDVWMAARNFSFINKFVGSGPNSMVQRITELTKTEKGDRAVMTLVADLEGDGVVGDNQLEGNEESIKAYDEVITIDQLRNANRSKGRMTDQRSIVKFRETSRDVLAYWLADRLDQMAFLSMSGISYNTKNNGAARPASSQLNSLAFAADVTAPSTNRHYRWDTTTGMEPGNTALVSAADTPSYAMLVEAKAIAKEQYIRGIRGAGGDEIYHVFMTPTALSKLKLDADFLANVRNAGPRSGKNVLFSGSIPTIDGLVIHEYRHVYNNSGLPDGSRWGASTDVTGCRVIFAGAQALGMADLGNPYWDEVDKDYNNQQGISVGKICGLLKPRFNSIYSGNTVEDFGLMVIDVAQGGND